MVDPGFVKQIVYNSKTGIDQLVVTPISQVSPHHVEGNIFDLSYVVNSCVPAKSFKDALVLFSGPGQAEVRASWQNRPGEVLQALH